MLLLHHQPNNPNASRSHNIPLPHVIIAGDAGSLSSSGLIVSFPPLPPHLALADHLRLGPTLHHTGGPCCLMRLRLRCEPRRPQLQETTCFRTRTPPTTMTRQAPHTMSLHIGPAQVLLSYYPTTNGDQASHQGDDRRTRSDGRTAHPGPSHHSSVTLPAFVDENRGRNQPGRIPQQSCSRTVPDLSEIAATSDLGRQPCSADAPPTPAQEDPPTQVDGPDWVYRVCCRCMLSYLLSFREYLDSVVRAEEMSTEPTTRCSLHYISPRIQSFM